MSLHRNFVVPETGAGGVGRLDEMSNLAFASRLAIARFRRPRDPRTLIGPSLAARRRKEPVESMARFCRCNSIGFGPSSHRPGSQLAAVSPRGADLLTDDRHRPGPQLAADQPAALRICMMALTVSCDSLLKLPPVAMRASASAFLPALA